LKNYKSNWYCALTQKHLGSSPSPMDEMKRAQVGSSQLVRKCEKSV